MENVESESIAGDTPRQDVGGLCWLLILAESALSLHVLRSYQPFRSEKTYHGLARSRTIRGPLFGSRLQVRMDTLSLVPCNRQDHQPKASDSNLAFSHTIRCLLFYSCFHVRMNCLSWVRVRLNCLSWVRVRMNRLSWVRCKQQDHQPKARDGNLASSQTIGYHWQYHQPKACALHLVLAVVSSPSTVVEIGSM